MSKKLKGKLKMKHRKKNINPSKSSKKKNGAIMRKSPDYSMGKEEYMKPLSKDERENVVKSISHNLNIVIPAIKQMNVSQRELLKKRSNDIWNVLNALETYFKKYPDELTLKEYHELSSNFELDVITNLAFEQIENGAGEFSEKGINEYRLI